MTDFIKNFNSKNLFKNIIIFSIFRAIYGAFVLLFAYRITFFTDNNYFYGGLFFIVSMYLSRKIFKYIKIRFNL